MTMTVIVYLLVICGLATTSAFKILVAFPFPSPSHNILGNGVVDVLLKAGHEVTYITPILPKNPPPKLTVVDVSDNFKMLPELNLQQLMNSTFTMSTELVIFMTHAISKNMYEVKAVQDLLNDTSQKFDVVIAEWMYSDLYTGLAAVFDCPFIWVSSMDSHWLLRRLIDGPTNPAYTPDAISHYTPPFSFFQRAKELWSQIKVSIILKFIILPKGAAVFESICGPAIEKRGRTVPNYEDIVYNVSFILANSHSSLVPTSIALPLNVKHIGGYHIERPTKSLPQDLQKIMDESKNGVIYFSMGSNLKSKDMTNEMKRDILKVFGGLKQTVLWKFEEELPNLPTNVKILKWAPQPSILAHPKCLLFITHGGLLSSTETIHFGVPIIGVPVFADQFRNTNIAVANGIGLRVDLATDMANGLKEAINEILNNPKYRQRVNELSAIYHDRLNPPGVELVYWVEHVARTRGALHLRSPALHTPLYQKLYLDLLVVIIVLLIAVRLLFKKLISMCKSSKTNQKKKKS